MLVRPMRRLLRGVLPLLTCLLLLAAGAQARVVVVGVDGAGFTALDPLLAEGVLPNLQALMERGVHAELATVEPVNSPTVWTSIATGRRPDVHGITDFLKDARNVRVPTLFERLAVQGLRVGTYDYLMTWPPRALPGGFVIPGWMRRDDATAPPDALTRHGGPGYRYALRGIFGRVAYAANVRRELAEKPVQWRALWDGFAPDVGAVTFYAVDAASHRFFADAHPDEFEPGSVPEPDPAYAGLIREAFLGIDAAVGEIAAGLDPDDALLVVSDHGFQAEEGFRRVWSGRFDDALARADLVPGRDAFSVEGQFAYVFVRVHPGPFAEREALTDRLAAFFREAATPAGEPLFTVELLDVAPRPSEAARPWTGRLRQWGLRLLMEHVFSVHLSTDAHAFLLMRPDHDALESVWPGGRVRVAGREIPVERVIDGDGFTGRHHPTALFVAAGGALRAIPERGRLSVLDVAPLVAYLAGAAIPDDLEGTLPRDWLEPAVLAERPPRTVAARSLPRLPDPEAPPPGFDRERLEQLRSMGYLE